MSRRATMILSLAFGGLALLLSAAGIYGVLACAVSLRTQETGVRMAIGAETSDIFRTFLAQGLKLTLIGLGAGLAGAYYLTRLMTSLLYEVTPTEPAVFALVAAVLGVVAMAASLIPALRAARVHPMTALRV